jgi:hypothetical protein
MKRPCLLAFIEDAPTRSIVDQVASDKNLEIYPLGQGAPVLQYVKTLAPLMLIADLSGFGADWLYKHIAEIKNMTPTFPIAAFIPKAEEALRRRLESAGLKSIFFKTEIEKYLPEMIENVMRMKY